MGQGRQTQNPVLVITHSHPAIVQSAAVVHDSRLDALLAFGGRTSVRGLPIDPTRPLGVGPDLRDTPSVRFDPPAAPGAHGFMVLAGSYRVSAPARDALTMFWGFAPPGEPWSVVRASQPEVSRRCRSDRSPPRW